MNGEESGNEAGVLPGRNRVRGRHPWELPPGKLSGELRGALPQDKTIVMDMDDDS
jgi:hypothetical protein